MVLMLFLLLLLLLFWWCGEGGGGDRDLETRYILEGKHQKHSNMWGPFALASSPLPSYKDWTSHCAFLFLSQKCPYQAQGATNLWWPWGTWNCELGDGPVSAVGLDHLLLVCVERSQVNWKGVYLYHNCNAIIFNWNWELRSQTAVKKYYLKL